jgi:hypothetical protein
MRDEESSAIAPCNERVEKFPLADQEINFLFVTTSNELLTGNVHIGRKVIANRLVLCHSHLWEAIACQWDLVSVH